MARYGGDRHHVAEQRGDDWFADGIRITFVDGAGSQLSQETIEALSLAPGAELHRCVSCRTHFIAYFGAQTCSAACAKKAFREHFSRWVRVRG